MMIFCPPSNHLQPQGEMRRGFIVYSQFDDIDDDNDDDDNNNSNKIL